MRLGQLARQLSISPDKIITFLGSREILIDNNNNARIDDRYVDLILQEFAPGDDALRQQVIQAPEATEGVENTLDSSSPEASNTETPELIKAPKVELPGLRVIGKIELPEKKKPEPKKELEKEIRSPLPSRNPGKNSPPRDRKNPIALAREREEREKQRRLAEQREKEKQRKAEYYQKRLKPQAPTKPAKLVQEETVEMPPLEPEKPKTLWGRFMRWLNT
ncbi:MAG: hypothetical protein JNL40_11960 [Cyclobacteriaceae bacterium]|nr:hypothetical protein [Cyclobacteriaceae bacterium]